ncbi:MAG: MauE/DoxX family redox-associated membrane protein [bacterium]
MDSSRKLLRILAFLCRIGLAAVFLFAAWPKLQDPAAFAKAIWNYRMALPLLGMNYVNAMALFLPALELVLALALVVGIWRRGASLLTMAFMLLFIIAISSAVARGLNIDCGCFGTSQAGVAIAHKVGLRRLLEDVAYFFMAGVVFWEALIASRKVALR